MSEKLRFKISVKHLLVYSSITLAGVLIASVFIRLADDRLIETFLAQFKDYFEFASHKNAIFLVLQELFWLLLIISASFLPHGGLLSILLLLYKGFSIGIVSSVFCKQFGAIGIKYILLTVLPQNVFYIISLCVALQISGEISNNTITRGRHGKLIQTDHKAFYLCALITIAAGLLEAYIIPLIYRYFF